ncbi:MAG: 5-formyltetrahydrofolate cyclo-ligase [Prochlorococcaceae cyanobacterium]
MNKAELRQHFRRQRRQLLPTAQAPIQALAQRQLPSQLGQGRLGIYWPLAGEVDLRPLVAWLPGRLALPAAVVGAQGTTALVYRSWDPAEPLSPDACGIPAPTGPDLEPAALALLLVPALAYDRRGLRLGSGGGWYDRLRASAAWRAVPALVVAPAGCAVDALPGDPWDIPFAGWLNEQELHWLQPPPPRSPPGPSIATS